LSSNRTGIDDNMIRLAGITHDCVPGLAELVGNGFNFTLIESAPNHI
jgi:hypothetical protein